MEDYWHDTPSSAEKPPYVPTDIADLSFRADYRGGLAIDHAYLLYRAISSVLPWFDTAPNVALHTLHGAESGNGWLRPSEEDDLLYLSHRTRMRLRLPKSRFEDAMLLVGKVLQVGSCTITVHRPTLRALSTQKTLFTRFLVVDDTGCENEFISHAAQMLQAKEIRPRRIMGGRQNTIKTPDKTLYARSLMVADLSLDESIRLQQVGLGVEQKLGCGIFLPHKGVDAVYSPKKDSRE